ncbi:hypothetical protein OAE79_00840 [Rhodopirellula sp.]|nr:hypothetical protein [Rhodopirellula sp.]MDB4678857.1 hypothetical protein [Rhodopirellula sp.]
MGYLDIELTALLFLPDSLWQGSGIGTIPKRKEHRWSQPINALGSVLFLNFGAT